MSNNTKSFKFEVKGTKTRGEVTYNDGELEITATDHNFDVCSTVLTNETINYPYVKPTRGCSKIHIDLSAYALYGLLEKGLTSNDVPNLNVKLNGQSGPKAGMSLDLRITVSPLELERTYYRSFKIPYKTTEEIACDKQRIIDLEEKVRQLEKLIMEKK